MDAALGTPEAMAENREDLTPMMSQYIELCEQYPDSLVLFQVGDFYETFCEAAKRTARLLEITLTAREDSTGRYPMSGIPVDNAEGYIETLLDAGYRVAVADQVQEPSETTGVVDRAVTRIVTPGTLTEDEFLDEDNNFVASVAREMTENDEWHSRAANGDPTSDDVQSGLATNCAGAKSGDDGAEVYGLAVLDVSTGDFYATGGTRGEIADEIDRFAPSEAILSPGMDADLFDADTMVTPFRPDAFTQERARRRVKDYFGSPDALLAGEAEIEACGGLLAYAEYTRAGESDRLEYLTTLTRYDPREYLLLDAVALRSLELFERRTIHGEDAATVFATLDETACALGARQLTDWLRRPLVDEPAIRARHDAVEELVGNVAIRERLHDELRDVYDLERLISRVSRGRANARDLRSLKTTLDVVPALRDALEGTDSDHLRDLRLRLDPLDDVRDSVGKALQDDPPIELTEGGLVREGYDADLDALRETEREGKAWIESLQDTERERTGIDSLKVGYNQVHGYYIEVTDPNLDAVPDNYRRRQTLKNAERFITPGLKEREDEIVRAEGRADDLEYELFTDLRASVAAETERVQDVADAVATLDAFQSLATVAAERDYCRPAVGADRFHIEAGRHPVVERTRPSFVPNPTDLDRGAVAVITGPNMAGKSTYMRQVALIQALAQAGSFVPAATAALPIVDSVFTRVGASDDIAGGQSTFMVEMTELSSILRNATPDSLVLLDEVGRGTSTTDGLAIARAVTEHLHDIVGATTLFATHHHDLTATAASLDRALNLHFAADGSGDEVAFSHELRNGPAGASYGVEVARSAGVPDPVVSRAHELLDTTEETGAAGTVGGIGLTDAPTTAGEDLDSASGGHERTNGHTETRTVTDGDSGPQKPVDGGRSDSIPPTVQERLERADVATTTPLEALELVADLKAALDNGPSTSTGIDQDRR